MGPPQHPCTALAACRGRVSLSPAALCRATMGAHDITAAAAAAAGAGCNTGVCQPGARVGINDMAEAAGGGAGPPCLRDRRLPMAPLWQGSRHGCHHPPGPLLQRLVSCNVELV